MSNQRKRNKLMRGKKEKPLLNFGGQNRELWCEGGEYRFVSNMIAESKGLGKQVMWFSSLVSKSAHLKGFEKQLLEAGVKDMKVIPVGQGSKISRILAWSFLDEKERSNWRKPVVKEAAKPGTKTATKTATKATAKPAAKKAAKPATKKVTKPANEKVPNKAVKPATETVTKKATKSGSEKVPKKAVKEAKGTVAKKPVKAAPKSGKK